MLKIRTLDSTAADFWSQLDAILAWETIVDTELQGRVDAIISAVRTRGDAALVEFTRRFDGWEPLTAVDLMLSSQRLERAWHAIAEAERQALTQAQMRIRRFAERQRLDSFSYQDADGTLLGQQVTALDSVGLYVPGGKAAYPSSVLMNAIPAVVAGVPQLVMVVPTPQGAVNELVLAAAYLVGVNCVFAIGGAQAVAALAYGTETVPKVDKIVGPGNSYVAAAKRAVFGQVGIDMIAGPSEILIVCDGATDPDWIAMDLFSQAEHDQDAQAILMTQDAEFITKVQASIERLLPSLERHNIIAAALRARGAMILVRDLTEACAVANYVAPEHLELSVAAPQELVSQIRHAGAIFMGRYTAEALGDYCAGPNHVLPTSRTARFSSALGTYDFQKRSSLIMATATSAASLGKTAVTLARGEGLTAHARSAEYRSLSA